MIELGHNTGIQIMEVQIMIWVTIIQIMETVDRNSKHGDISL
jgi:hypothetical protein